MNYESTDASGNTVVIQREVLVVDTHAPVITLNGDQFLLMEAGMLFVDPGANAIDAFEGAMDVEIIGSVDIQNQGRYLLQYVARQLQQQGSCFTTSVVTNPEQSGLTTLSINFASDEPMGGGSEVLGIAGVNFAKHWNNLTGATGVFDGLVMESNESPMQTDISVQWYSDNTFSSWGRRK